MKDLVEGLAPERLLLVVEYNIESYITRYRESFGASAEIAASTGQILRFYDQSRLLDTYSSLAQALGVERKYS